MEIRVRAIRIVSSNYVCVHMSVYRNAIKRIDAIAFALSLFQCLKALKKEENTKSKIEKKKKITKISIDNKK